MSDLTHSIAFCPAVNTNKPSKPDIVRGVLYEDPIAGRNLKWFIGTITRNGDPALTCLSTGNVYTYPGGKVPGAIQRVGPGTLSIVILEDES